MNSVLENGIWLFTVRDSYDAPEGAILVPWDGGVEA